MLSVRMTPYYTIGAFEVREGTSEIHENCCIASFRICIKIQVPSKTQQVFCAIGWSEITRIAILCITSGQDYLMYCHVSFI